MTKLQKTWLADAIMTTIIIVMLAMSWPADPVTAILYVIIAAAFIFTGLLFFYINILDYDDHNTY